MKAEILPRNYIILPDKACSVVGGIAYYLLKIETFNLRCLAKASES